MAPLSDKLLETMRKVARLAERAGTEGEAQAAALTLQCLMNKHGITESDITESDPETKEAVTEVVDEMGAKQHWKGWLASIIADNFRVVSYWSGFRHTHRLKFMGLPEDVAAAVTTYRMTVKAINKLLKKHTNARKEYDYNILGLPRWTIAQGHEARASYIGGFITGLEDAFRAQVADTSCAIVLVKDAIVVQAEEELGLKTGARSI